MDNGDDNKECIISQAFDNADNVLAQSVKTVVNLIILPSMITPEKKIKGKLINAVRAYNSVSELFHVQPHTHIHLMVIQVQKSS